MVHLSLVIDTHTHTRTRIEWSDRHKYTFAYEEKNVYKSDNQSNGGRGGRLYIFTSLFCTSNAIKWINSPCYATKQTEQYDRPRISKQCHTYIDRPFLFFFLFVFGGQTISGSAIWMLSLFCFYSCISRMSQKCQTYWDQDNFYHIVEVSRSANWCIKTNKFHVNVMRPTPIFTPKQIDQSIWVGGEAIDVYVCVFLCPHQMTLTRSPTYSLNHSRDEKKRN